MYAAQSKRLPDCIRKLACESAALVLPTPLFDVKFGVVENYDSLFSSTFCKRLCVDNLLRCSRYGRVVISGKGGGAKTITLRRLAKAALEKGDLPVFISLRDWTSRDSDCWEKLKSHPQRLDYLLAHFTQAGASLADLEFLDPSIRRTLLIDGLNEVRPSIGQAIIYAADYFARYCVNSYVILSDRLVRRTLDSAERWTLVTTLPLSDAAIRKVIRSTFGGLDSKTRELISSPYFLSRYLADSGRALKSKASEFEQYFTEHALSACDLEKASKAAVEVYKTKSRTFTWSSFRRVATGSVADKLETAGAVIRVGEFAYFDHHLKHDYLASRYLAGHPECWGSEEFHLVTFSASSFDALSMAMEQIPDTANADRFLRSVYDWNIYGAGYVLSDSKRCVVSSEMQLVMLATFAERRWDIIEATAKRAEDTLNLISGGAALALRAANSHEEIYSVLDGVSSKQEWFLRWRSAFVRQANATATAHDVSLLREGDAVAGWAASNILKRLNLTLDMQAKVREILAHDRDNTIRWRAAHVLGAFPSARNAQAVFTALLDDHDRFVKYGSVRSLVEMAARSESVARAIFAMFREHAEEIAAAPMLLEEFRNSAIIKPAYYRSGWRTAIAEVVKAFQANLANPDEDDQWTRFLIRMVTIYAN